MAVAHPGILESLFDRYVDGDAEAFEAIYEVTAPSLSRLAARYAYRNDDVEELVQSTFLAAIEKRERFDPNLPLLPWLCGILVRLAYQERRSRARKPVQPLDGEELEAEGADPLEEVLAIEFATVLALGVSALDPPYREVLSLRLHGDLTTAQIARALDRSHSTVRTQLGRGLVRLRRFLATLT